MKYTILAVIIVGLLMAGCGGHSSKPAPPQPAPANHGKKSFHVMEYHGRYNGDRPTWYAHHNMGGFPQHFIIDIEGCKKLEVSSHNAKRWEHGGYILKQSDVPGRGMALVAPKGCKSKVAKIAY